MTTQPPSDLTGLQPIDEVDKYWQRHMLPLIARLEQKYPHLFADDFVVAPLPASPTPITAVNPTRKSA